MFTNSPAARLWRPAAQRNLRNQWSKFASLRHDWRTASSDARSNATSLVNSYLSQKYMDSADFGVLKNMPGIRQKACEKLFKQQELYRTKLLSSYRDMVGVMIRMAEACNSMRCYSKGTKGSSPLVQFSSSCEDGGDSGDCGGATVFKFWSIASFEELAKEVVKMFRLELSLKRLIVMELLYVHNEKVGNSLRLQWCDEFYKGEFDDLRKCDLYTEESCEPVHPSLNSDVAAASEYKHQKLDSNVLQVYLTTWIVEVNIDRYRVDDIFADVGEEMHVELS